MLALLAIALSTADVTSSQQKGDVTVNKVKTKSGEIDAIKYDTKDYGSDGGKNVDLGQTGSVIAIKKKQKSVVNANASTNASGGSVAAHVVASAGGASAISGAHSSLQGNSSTTANAGANTAASSFSSSAF